MSIGAQLVALIAAAGVGAKVVVAQLRTAAIVQRALVDVRAATGKVLFKAFLALAEEGATGVHAKGGVVRTKMLMRLLALVNVCSDLSLQI